MKTAILRGAKKLVIEDIPKPRITNDQVLIRMKEVGLCGSDVHFYNDFGIPGFAMIEDSLILGHESSGIIAEVGTNVTGLKVGDRVSVEAGIPCYRCNQCKTGNYNLCDQMEFMAAPPINGAFREYVAHDPCFAHKIPDNVSYAAAAMVEPLSCGYNSGRIGEIKPGQSVCIFGDGPIGLACLDICKAMGATRIFLTGHHEYRLDIARKHGAFRAVNVLHEEIADVIHADTKGEGVDCAIECCGKEKPILQSLEVIKREGMSSGCPSVRISSRSPILMLYARRLQFAAVFAMQTRTRR